MAHKPTTGTSPFDVDFTKLISDLKWPAVPDMSALMTATQRNMEALTAANKVALQGAQALAQRNMEVMQQAAADMSAAMQVLTGPAGPEVRAEKQTELVKNAYEHAIKNLREIGELIQNTNAEALKVLQARFEEAMAEVSDLAKKK